MTPIRSSLRAPPSLRSLASQFGQRPARSLLPIANHPLIWMRFVDPCQVGDQLPDGPRRAAPIPYYPYYPWLTSRRDRVDVFLDATARRLNSYSSFRYIQGHMGGFGAVDRHVYQKREQHGGGARTCRAFTARLGQQVYAQPVIDHAEHRMAMGTSPPAHRNPGNSPVASYGKDRSIPSSRSIRARGIARSPMCRRALQERDLRW